MGAFAEPEVGQAQVSAPTHDRRLCVDFACPAVKLVVEFDGPLHDEPEHIEFDARRTEYLQLNGWRVIRFKNDEVFADSGAVLRTIIEAVGD